MKLPEKILYAHEHTTIDLSGPKKNIDCRLDDFDATAAEYRRLAEHGVVGIIDQTNRGMGRNVAYVQKMAAQAGVEITHATGYYKEPFLPPECYTLTEQQLCDIMVKELTEGIEGTGVRATVIGEIGTSKDITESGGQGVPCGIPRPCRNGGTHLHPHNAGHARPGAAGDLQELWR